MSSDEADSKSEKMNDLESKHDDSKSENESDPSPEPVKTNIKAGKKKVPTAPKIKAPAKKRVKEAEKEAEKDAKEEERKKESKKKVEESEEDNEEDEDDEIEDDKKNGVKKGVPLLDQPLEITGSRERKQVQRFSVIKSSGTEDQKVIEIPEGSGKALGTIPRINNNLERYKVENLKLLHKVCFNRTGKVPVIKKNIRKFNGFDFDKDSTDYEKKRAMLSKFGVKDLKTICMILDLERTKKKEDLVKEILEFLMNPEDSGKPLPEGRSKRKNATLKTYDESDVELEVNSDNKKKKSQKAKGKKKNLKDESDSSSEKDDEEMNDKEDVDEEKIDDNASSKSENESELDEEEYETIASETFVIPQDEPKKKKTKKAPAKTKEKKTVAPPKKRAVVKRAALAKKKKADESDDDDGEAEEEDNAESGDESDEADDTPLVKKGKSPPTEDEIKAYVKSILEGANLEEITMKTVCKQVYSHYPDFDLGHKKDFIKTTVKSLISS